MITKKEKDFINNEILENQKDVEKIEKTIQSLEKERNYFQNEITKNEITIKNFKDNISFLIYQNKEIEKRFKIFNSKKQKIIKVFNFFITIFSFGKINKNKWQKQTYELLNETKLKNQKDVEKIEKTIQSLEKETNKNLITNINKITENINKLFNHKNKLLQNNNNLSFELLNQKKEDLIIEVDEQTIEKYESEIFKLNEKIFDLENKLLQNNNNLSFELLNQKKEDLIIEVDEQTIEKYESEIFKLNEKICDLENKLLSSSSDEGFHSKSTSTNSLHSGNSLSLNKQNHPKVINNPTEKIKPWEQNLGEYPTEKSIQKNKLALVR